MAVDNMQGREQKRPPQRLLLHREKWVQKRYQTRATMKAGDPIAPRLEKEQSRGRTFSCLRRAASKNPKVLNSTKVLENTFLGIENKSGAAPGGLCGPTAEKGKSRCRARDEGRVFIPRSAGRTS